MKQLGITTPPWTWWHSWLPPNGNTPSPPRVERGTVRVNDLHKNKTHDLARLQMQISWPWLHLTNHKATMSPQEERVYGESFLIRNNFYKTKVKFSYLIFK